MVSNGKGVGMIQFIVSDPECPLSNSTNIHKHGSLLFTRCNPKMVEKVRDGLQGLTGNLIPVYNHTDWEFQVRKHLTGKG